MRERFTRHSFIAVPFLLALFFFTGLINAYAVPIFGVTTSNALVRFESTSPSNSVVTVATITGLQAGENILGIDFRPANGQLYALGSSSRIYIINPRTGVATAVGAAGAFTLTGTDFGFDFNPVADLIRIVSNTGQNLRVNPNTGALTGTDTNLNPGTPSVTATAYSNDFVGTTATTQYDIDTATDRLFIQNPPNAGTLTLVGSLGVDATGVNGFDIASRRVGADVNSNMAFAALTVGGTTGIYSINLTTGAATLVTNGSLPAGTALRGIAVSSFASAASRFLDFDGDNRTDLAVFRVATNTFFARRSGSTNALDILGLQFGNAQTDDLVPADYNGDGITDFAVYRRDIATNLGTFFVQDTARVSSPQGFRAFQFGFATDQPVPRDYDGDNRADFAVVRRTPGATSLVRGTLTWFILQSSTNTLRSVQFGFDVDTPAPGDYDGDGRFDIAVFRNEVDGTGTFFILQSSTNTVRAVRFGLGSDLVIPGDYDGDGRTDIAVVRQGDPFQFFILRSSDNSFLAVTFGEKPQIPAPGDYDGDGRTDIAVFDPRNGVFYILESSSNNTVVRQRQFGQNGDIPLARSNTF